MGGKRPRIRHDFTTLPVEESMNDENEVDDTNTEAVPRVMRVSDAPSDSKFYTDAET